MKTNNQPIFTQGEPKHGSAGSPFDLKQDLQYAGWHVYKLRQCMEKLSLFCSLVNDSHTIKIESEELKFELEELQYSIRDFLPNVEEFFKVLAEKESSILEILEPEEDKEK